jgi:DNA-binding NarL/FixJ family response regulator
MKKILFVDDQWCRDDEQSLIEGAYGQLLREDCEFLYETAFDSQRRIYSADLVSERVRKDDPSVVILDMDFTYERYDGGEGFGKTILSKLVQDHSGLAVIIHSSSSDSKLKEDCLNIGAQGWLEKKATYNEMKDVVDKYGKIK